ncbi:CHASE domain-containing protein/sensory box histidine kinase [Pseudomonas sp. StFLB209]|uniref:sensor domain-containing diguanylate cyclase n=1 Tax=Pseudomonas sp. StFLB209 TaxID=1028989 RepID=UPI0004F84104|nr:diguanylate cyclase [Pseudomonas sp. StFLB209]BAP44585.1 CHASE domain-containing protein/sensory box histidine kinase [Pseudomonas sp. StFLB209]
MAAKQSRPRILGFISEQASAWLVASLVLMAGLALTALLALSNYELYQRQLRQRFDLLASERFVRIQERLDSQISRLDSLRRFFLYSKDVSRHEYNGFSSALLDGTRAYSWSPRVTDAERADFEAKVRREQELADFAIREKGPDGQLQVAGQREEYFPVLFTQSMSSLPLPYGFDINSETLRHQTLERARMLGSIAATPRIELVGLEQDYAYGVLLVAPVFATHNRDAGSAALRGYVMAVISVGELMNEGLPTQDNLAVTMLDLSSPAEPELLYQSQAQPAQADLRVSTLLSLGDRDYLLEVRPTESFLQNNQSMAGSVAVLGGLLSLMLSALLFSLIGQRQRALLLVDQRTAQLRLREQQLRITHGQLRNVLDASTEVAIIATDLNGLISTFNVGAQKMLDYPEAQVLGRVNISDLHDPAELHAHAARLSERYRREVMPEQAMLLEAAEPDSHPAREWTFRRSDGSTLTVNMLVTAVRDDQDQWIGYLAVCIDVTERKQIHEALAARDRLLERLGSQVPGGIYQFQRSADGSPQFNYISVGMCRLYELTEAQIVADASLVFERTYVEDKPRVMRVMAASTEQCKPWRDEFRLNLPERGIRWIRGEATPERLPDGGILWHGFLSDITDMKRVEDELRALSITDVLTGAYNRRYFQERLQAELRRTARHGGQLSVIMMDIDHFKRINDQYGHAVGDAVLQAICRSISQRVRAEDVFCRLGGEEFIILCPSTHPEEAGQLATQLWQSMRSQPLDTVGQVTASFGIASWRRGEGADALLLRADSGVYAAKQAGRDRVQPEQP